MPRKTARKTDQKTDPAPPQVETPPQAEDKPSKGDTPPAETASAADEPAKPDPAAGPQQDTPPKPDPLTAGQALDPATLGVTFVAPEEPLQAEVAAPPVKAPVPAPAPPAEAASVADDPAKPGPEGAQTREAGPDEPAHLLIVVRRPHRFGGEERPVGWPLAEVRLAPGVDINTVVDAVRNGFATDAPADCLPSR